MTSPELSVVIPAHDAADWIGELLDSVLTQDVGAMEVLVVDDRSSDRTVAIVDGVRAKDPRVRLLAAEAPGGAGARNTGAAAARGEYLVFADADDLVPPGVYRSMVDTLVASRSDLVVGDHLKFSASATWSPTKRWYGFDAAVTGTTILATPELLTGRACWNRMFRREFWLREGLRFPAVGHADDIVPMTQAVLRARSIDVLPDCVYLYRDRLGGLGASMSNRTDEAALLDYLREETTCARLVRGEAPDLLQMQTMLVLDADGWVHVDRYFAQLGDDGSPSPAVRAALEELFRTLDLSMMDRVAAERRCLFALLLIGRYDEAVRFAASVRNPGDGAGTRLSGWVEAMQELVSSPAPSELDRPALIEQGLMTTLLHDADTTGTAALVPIVRTLRSILEEVPPAADGRSELQAAVRRAVIANDAEAVRSVSLLRHDAPIVVDQVHATQDELVLTGPAAQDRLFTEAAITMRTGDASVSSAMSVGGGRWSVRVPARGLRPGRWSVSVSLRLSTVEVEVPVVTARMPLPPLGNDHLLQPLSDRKDGWRFLIDRRTPPRLLSKVRGAIARRRGPQH